MIDLRLPDHNWNQIPLKFKFLNRNDIVVIAEKVKRLFRYR